jgi:transcription termination factor NusB
MKGGGTMPDGITHNNKDVVFKVLSRNYENKSLAVYGLNLPRIKQLLPANYPAVMATEIYADNLFLLEDGSLLILEYESSPVQEDFFKYGKYVIYTLERLRKDGINVKKVIIAVIYTGDIKSSASELDVGALRVQVEQVFLSKFDTDSMYAELKTKITSGEVLDDDDVMKLIILPLTQSNKTHKQKLIEDAIDLAKQVKDEQQQLFIVAGILTATNKFIDSEYSKQIKEWIRLTKVARLFEEEKIEAVNAAVNDARREERLQIARGMFADGDDILKVMRITKLTRAELDGMGVLSGV